MKFFLTSVVVILLAMAGMAVGMFFGRRSLRRCDGGRTCEFCAEVSEHESSNREDRNGVRAGGSETRHGGPPPHRNAACREQLEQAGSESGRVNSVHKEFENA